MKKILCLLMALIMIFTLTSCIKKRGDNAYHSSRFIVASENQGARNNPFSYYTETVFYDKETGVMYLGVRSGSQLAMTVLLNADGTPMLYKPAS